jgi:hypothetical protein
VAARQATRNTALIARGESARRRHLNHHELNKALHQSRRKSLDRGSETGRHKEKLGRRGRT